MPTKLRSYFVSEFARKYGSQYGNDPASGTFFLSNVLPRNKCRDAEVKRKVQNGDSTAFDCTTLFYCILYSGALLQPPMRQKSMRIPPLNSSELIDLLREHRNMLAHATSAEIDQVDFNTRVNDLQAIYRQLGWSCTDLLQAATGPLTTAECFKLQQALMTEMARNNALDQIVQSLDGRLLAVEGMLTHVPYIIRRILMFESIQNANRNQSCINNTIVFSVTTPLVIYFGVENNIAHCYLSQYYGNNNLTNTVYFKI